MDNKTDKFLNRIRELFNIEIDKKVIALVKEQYEKASSILSENRHKLDELADFLYEKETITGEQFMEILHR